VKIFDWNFLANFYSSPESIALSSTARVNAAQNVHSHRRKKFLPAKNSESNRLSCCARSDAVNKVNGKCGACRDLRNRGPSAAGTARRSVCRLRPSPTLTCHLHQPAQQSRQTKAHAIQQAMHRKILEKKFNRLSSW
jgi:hypothetical protein